MNCTIVTRGQEEYGPEAAVAVPVFSDEAPTFGTVVKEKARESLRLQHEQGRIVGKAQASTFVLLPRAPYAGVVTLGLGPIQRFDAECLRRAAGAACATLQQHRIAHVIFDATGVDALPVEALIEGIILGQYDYDAYKKASEDPVTRVEAITIVVDEDAPLEDLRTGCATAITACENANWARDLANMPPNDLVPSALAARAEALGRELGVDTSIMDVDQMRLLGMNAILGVGRGSSKAPKLIQLHYRHPDATRTLALVGKGITFDTGGISLKGGLDMHEMKYDMCGAAAVLGAFKTIGTLKPPINVICVVPAAENKPGSDAQRPGDIIRAYNGTTIEIHNTDAEGRLVLADALAYVAERYKPDAMVDIATLTGAMVVALGHFAAGVMGTDDGLIAELGLAADASGERIWPFPLWDDYAELIKGTHADLCNIGPRGQAGSITAACFLKAFTGGVPWAHLDIAGTAWGVQNIPYWDPKHATGFGARLLAQWVLNESSRG